uniref:Bestrophin homolog n=1 Tax=Haemonchus contortus TaxID=6289 RepID=A0A7I4YS64_HAECO
MTVSYNSAVSSNSTITFFRLLLRWRGSIWKSISGELLLWTICYYIVFVIYRFALTAQAQRKFEQIAGYIDEHMACIPLTFMLGFFVSIIIRRWRDTFENMGWIENLALTLVNLLEGGGRENTNMRRTIIRYTVLSQVLVFRDISMRVRRRFPTMDSLVDAGFMSKQELEELSKIELAYNRYWKPLHWAIGVSFQALEKKYFETPWARICVQNEIESFRTNLALLCNFDWVPVPISYPQVVFLAVRSYFVLCLVCRQFLVGDEVENRDDIEFYVPFMTLLEYTFLVGWMKVAEGLLNPLGEDDDDFECSFVIDKNITTGFYIVDNEYGACPDLTPDRFTDPEYNPIFFDDSEFHDGGGVLMGSAEQHSLETQNENNQTTSEDHLLRFRRASSGGRRNTLYYLSRRLSMGFHRHD